MVPDIILQFPNFNEMCFNKLVGWSTEGFFFHVDSRRCRRACRCKIKILLSYLLRICAIYDPYNTQ